MWLGDGVKQGFDQADDAGNNSDVVDNDKALVCRILSRYANRGPHSNPFVSRIIIAI
jgi:hypothetical protein